ncbi:MAG: rhodanese-like domain-containing protein [Gemmatimonadales bacterium]
MLVRRFYDDRLAQASYLIACQRTGEAIVIDPARDITTYLEAARDEGVRITRVTETHIHADFVSGARELAARTGATPLLSAEGGADWQYGWAASDGAMLLHDGDVITLGGVRLEVWHTPGHTPEHLAFLVVDSARSEVPVALVSGDFVFVGDVGRPDLLEKAAHVAGTMAAGAKQLFASLQRLAVLPDHLQIWPGHGAGSACGKALGAMPTSTLGYERRSNWAFAISDEAAFVASVLEGQPNPPTYFGTMKRINRDGPPVLGALDPVATMPDSQIAMAVRETAVVDLRPFAQYAEGHVAGTLNLPLIKAFTTWAGWLLRYDRDISLISPDAASTAEARRALASIGLDRVRGAFAMSVVESARRDGRTARVTKGDVTAAESLMEAGRTVIDLREDNEWNAGHIPGAEHHPLGTLAEAMTGVERDAPLAIHCQSGTRSAIGASLLDQLGFTDVIDLTGGWSAWSASARKAPA